MTRTQAVGLAILGVWVGWSLFMWYAAGRSFTTVERVLQKPRPEVAEAGRSLGADQTRTLLRYLASEINRAYFGAYGLAQIVLGLVLFGLLWRSTPRDTLALVLVGVMLALVLGLTLIVTPQIVSLGRSMDFVPRTPPPPGMQRFWMLHGAFTALDGAKLLAGIVLIFRWVVKA